MSSCDKCAKCLAGVKDGFQCGQCENVFHLKCVFSFPIIWFILLWNNSFYFNSRLLFPVTCAFHLCFFCPLTAGVYVYTPFYFNWRLLFRIKCSFHLYLFARWLLEFTSTLYFISIHLYCLESSVHFTCFFSHVDCWNLRMHFRLLLLLFL